MFARNLLSILLGYQIYPKYIKKFKFLIRVGSGAEARGVTGWLLNSGS